ncbi:DLH domain-containing protein [Fusarium keratoplasticum]|uniref:DLH domain-containing protein n=1 Tax=Fusarium keratoplasticum TaxID=1328300 RepID=A0ACC0QS90_9HYPO|nr:DLH domain-containing protein [Fusarium keratoplasticum]KAI8663534.1 DLH domain-containing protein [Fusarium keratoplasticum]
MHFTRVLVGLYGFAAFAAAQWSGDIFKSTGKPTGTEIEYDGLTLYISKPKVPSKGDTAVLYLSDVYGLPLLENKLLVDSFARAGYLTIAPDILNGDPADPNVPFNAQEYLSRHNPQNTDPIIEKTIGFIHKKLKIDTIAVTGYCYGGRYAFRFLAGGRGANVGFAAHPTLLQNDEVLAIHGPASLAAAEFDSLLNATQRSEVEALLGKTPQPFQVNLYSGTQHGFGVRANVSDPEQKFAKEAAFWQAVRWFGAWSSSN